ncbi:hypothetical protein, partial [Algoriphagus sp.]|uniref:hypothetical protein n=1 Tax=Algoriphagus sp. TaxID=1872435 RepID=UPI0027302068
KKCKTTFDLTCVNKTSIGRARWEDLPLPAAGRSEPAFGHVRWELWQILTFWFFWVKPKERRKKIT